MGISLVSLAVTAALPVVNVFLMCAIGAALAKKGILDARGRHMLSQVTFWVFIPSLTFINLGASVNLKDLPVWWILPVNTSISIALGLVIGWIFSRLLKVDEWFKNHFMCTLALGNVANLPLVLISSLCSSDNQFSASFHDGGCETTGIAYVAFSMWIAGAFQYTVAYNMLKKQQPNDEPLNKEGVSAEPSLHLMGNLRNPKKDVELAIQSPRDVRHTALPVNAWQGGAETETPSSIPRGSSIGEEGDGVASSSKDRTREFDESAPLMAGESRDESRDGEVGYRNESASFLRGHAGGQRQGEICSSKADAEQEGWQSIRRRLEAVPWGSYLNAPTLAAIAGLTVGCISMLKKLLFGNSAPLMFVSQSLQILSGAMIPCMMLVLGSSLSKGPGVTRLKTSVIVGAVVVRLLIMPALGTGVVMLMLKLQVFHPPNDLFLLVLLLCHATPTAMNLQTVATLVQNGEEELSCLLCFQYLIALVTLPLWMSFFVILITKK